MEDRDWASVIAGVLLGVVVGAVVAWIIVSPDPVPSGSGRASLSNALPSAPVATQDARSSDQMQRCIRAAKEVTPSLRRAASSVDQWEIHVGAMNKLVVGAITLQQATAFWNQTRVGAHHRIVEFNRAWARLHRQGLDCPSPAMLPAQAPHELRSCAREVADDIRVLHAARTAIDTWGRHVHSMNMLRMGKLSPSTASQRWIAMWQRGQHEIDNYHAAARTAQHAFGCTSPSVAASASPTPSP
jgi:hypothetical protein